MTANQRVLSLTLKTDVVLSERAATLGAHRTLDYIPGATLLGAAAQRLYEFLPSAEAWLVFHSGKVRFGDGLPYCEVKDQGTTWGGVGLPVPASWHRLKHLPKQQRPKRPEDRENKDSRKRLEPDDILNLQVGAFPDGSPTKALSSSIPAFARDRTVIEVERFLRMRTAIDAAQGLRREAALFGYESLRAGQRFLAVLDADDDVPVELFDQVCSALAGHTLRLGRSRQTEYGQVQCELDSTADLVQELLPRPGVGTADALVIWLLSDTAIEDASGLPVEIPTAQQLHPDLPDWPLDRDGSFIRFRRYSPYNAFLRCHDVERIVIARGSVLRYRFGPGETPASNELDASIAKLSRGVGRHREAGLGRLWVNPDLLATATPRFERPDWLVRASAPPNATTQPLAGYDNDLLTWLKDRATHDGQRAENEKAASEWADQLRSVYRNAHRLAGLVGNEPVGPRPSQWGRVLTLAQKPGIKREKIMDELFEGKNAICSEGDDWGCDSIVPQEDGKGATTFRKWLKSTIEGEPEDQDLAFMLGRLAIAARKIADHEGLGKVSAAKENRQ